jgi:hypothetical protein
MKVPNYIAQLFDVGQAVAFGSSNSNRILKFPRFSQIRTRKVTILAASGSSLMCENSGHFSVSQQRCGLGS